MRLTPLQKDLLNWVDDHYTNRIAWMDKRVYFCDRNGIIEVKRAKNALNKLIDANLLAVREQGLGKQLYARPVI